MSAPASSTEVAGQEKHVSRRELLTLLSGLMAMTALAIDIMLPAFDEIRVAFDLGEGSNEVGRIITVYFLGMALAQIVYGPLADRFGRKPIVYLSLVIYVIGGVGSALAGSFELLLVARFVWGVGASGTRVVAVAIVRDRFEGNEMAKAMSQVFAVFVLVPVFAPTLGAGLIAVLPWESVFWFCVLAAIALGFWMLRLPETLDPAEQRPLELKTTASGMARVVRTPVTAGYSGATIFLQGVFVAYLASSELIISDIFGRGDQFPFIFGGIAIIFAVAALANGRLVEILGVEGVISRALVAVSALSLLLLIITLGADGDPNFWVFMPLFGVMLATFLFLMPNLTAVAMGPVGDIAGTASSVTGAVRMAGGAVAGAILSSQVTDSMTPFMIGTVVLIALMTTTVILTRRFAPPPA
ncbi:MAG: multidrug effflux MFS transporter [Acidimicrobiales bacterium]